MGAINKIMVAVGMNRFTEGLLKYAVDIADTMGAELICTSVINTRDVKELLKIAIKEDVDLMIMGIKSCSNLEYALIGSVAEKVFRRSPVSILSYRDEQHAERLRKHIDSWLICPVAI
jgi:nucleotide-binding universal stress UspA family protein